MNQYTHSSIIYNIDYVLIINYQCPMSVSFFIHCYLKVQIRVEELDNPLIKSSWPIMLKFASWLYCLESYCIILKKGMICKTEEWSGVSQWGGRGSMAYILKSCYPLFCNAWLLFKIFMVIIPPPLPRVSNTLDIQMGQVRDAEQPETVWSWTNIHNCLLREWNYKSSKYILKKCTPS